jgi:hypothetical protein
MSNSSLGLLIKAISSPSWVDITLLVVTTAYFIATVFVYRANKKMAEVAEAQLKSATKIAELSKNIELMNERYSLMDRIRIDDNAHPFQKDYIFMSKLNALFIGNTFNTDLNDFCSCFEKEKECEADWDEFTRNSYILQDNILDIFEEIFFDISEDLTSDETKKLKELADQNIISVASQTGEIRDLNIYDILFELNTWTKRKKNAKQAILDKMKAFIEESISI